MKANAFWRWLYSAAWILALPLAFGYLWQRGRKQPAYRQDWAERIGHYPPRPLQPTIWLHAVSVGETRAAVDLIHALRQRHPHHAIVLTQMTPTGREAAQQLLGDLVEVAYLPYDLPLATRRFLSHFQPDFGVLLEMELWPNLIEQARQQTLPLFLLNARLSERSFVGYRKIAWLIRPALSNLAGIAAQGDADAERLRALGATGVTIMGNLKFDFSPDAGLIEQGQRWRSVLGRRPVWAAVSTRDGEELLLLDAMLAHPPPADSLLILVPRHPQRFAEVADLLTEHGVSFVRRSEWDGESLVAAGTQVLLGDSMGEMAAWLAACDLAFIGGSLLDYGCHSVIEPCAQGVPVIVGPSSFNFADAVRESTALGAALQVPDVAALLQVVSTLLADAQKRTAMSAAGLRFVAAHRGAVAKAMAILP